MFRLLRRLVSSVTASALALAPLAARANPLNGQVTAGSATIVGAGTNNLTINQATPRAIIDWRSFNLAPTDTTQFVQPNAASVTLNRVTGGGGASQINGAIKANGGVYIVNPDGILFGPSATVNVGSFLGTTHNIANSDFMAGRNNFTISGNPSASIVNQGSITASSGGFAALVAPGVRNDGIITANLGTVALSSGNGFTLDLYGDNLIKLQPSDAIANDVRDVATGKTLSSLVENTGKLRAHGGTVTLTAVTAKRLVDSVINSSGVVEADSVGTRNGMVIFGAATAATKLAGAPIQTVKVSGKIRTAGHKAGTTGGKIQITGENIVLANANLDASGQAGGGKILIGGDFKGGDPTAPAVTQYGQSFESKAIPTATTVSVDAASNLDASARTSGNGGKVVVWSNDITTFAGSLFATGGATGGNGGFAEVSGKNTVNYDGIDANLSSRLGVAGIILFDPDNITIDANEALALENILNTGSDAAETADNTINLNSSIYKTAGGPASLTLNAATLNIADAVTIGSNHDILNVTFNVGLISYASLENDVINSLTILANSGLSAKSVGDIIVGSSTSQSGYFPASAAQIPFFSFLDRFSGYINPSNLANYNYYQSFRGLGATSSPTPTDISAYLSKNLTFAGKFSVYTNGGTFATNIPNSFPSVGVDFIERADISGCLNICGINYLGGEPGFVHVDYASQGGYSQSAQSNGQSLVVLIAYPSTQQTGLSKLPANIIISSEPTPNANSDSISSLDTSESNTILPAVLQDGYNRSAIIAVPGDVYIPTFLQYLLPAHTAEFAPNPIGGSAESQFGYASNINDVRLIAATGIAADAISPVLIEGGDVLAAGVESGDIGIAADVSSAPTKGAVADAHFAQSSINPTGRFSDIGVSTYSDIAGVPIKTVSDLASAIENGSVVPSQIPVDYVVIDGTRVILNTRTSVALSEAGVPQSQWFGSNVTGVQVPGAPNGITFSDLAVQQISRSKLPSTGTPIIPKGMK